MNGKQSTQSKAVVSVSEMAQTLKLSRSRFYQLVQQGIFPQPVYHVVTKRPIYTQELQDACREVRATSVGKNGQYILFYAPRTAQKSPGRPKAGGQACEFTSLLKNMGLETTPDQVEQALQELYPQGTEGLEQGEILRKLFKALRAKE